MEVFQSPRSFRDAHLVMLVISLVPIALRFAMSHPVRTECGISLEAVVFYDNVAISVLPLSIVLFGWVVHLRLESVRMRRALVFAQAALVILAALGACLAWVGVRTREVC